MPSRLPSATMPGIERYNEFKKYNLDVLLRWRNFPKPTIAMVDGYCIYAERMLAGRLDLVFAADSALFLAGVIEYMSVPWDIGVKRAKELVFESRFISADEAHEYGFVNHVYPLADLERETYDYARRVAESNPVFVRIAKVMMNKAQDIQGYSNHLEDALGGSPMAEGARRLASVDLAVRHRRGDRHGLTPPDVDGTGTAE